MKVTAVIPAYNEEKYISDVINTCLKTPEIGEIIIVNDGSTDKTLEKLKNFGKKIKIINFLKNKGKGNAIAAGVKKAKCEYLLFLDSDLVNIKPYHLSSLIWPVANNQADMTIGGINGLKHFIDLALWWTSGQRCLRKDLILSFLDEIERSGYGTETILNERLKSKRIAVVPLVSNKDIHTLKPGKQKNWLYRTFKETFQIIKSSYRRPF